MCFYQYGKEVHLLVALQEIMDFHDTNLKLLSQTFESCRTEQYHCLPVFCPEFLNCFLEKTEKNQKIFVGVFAVLFITGTIVGIYYAVKDMKEKKEKPRILSLFLVPIKSII